MKYLMKLTLPGMLALLFASGCAPQMTAERTHPEFASNKVDIERVAIVPPIVEFNKVEFSGEGVRDQEQEKTFESMLIRGAETALVERGYTPVVVEREQIAEELAAFNVDLGKLREQYNQARERLYQTPMVTLEESLTFQESVGEAAAIVASYADADAVLLMRYAGFEKTGGAVAKDVAVGVLVGLLTGYVPVANTEGETLEAAVLDGQTGNVLWVNAASHPAANNTALATVFEELQHDVDVNVEEDTGVAAEIESEPEVESATVAEDASAQVAVDSEETNTSL